MSFSETWLFLLLLVKFGCVEVRDLVKYDFACWPLAKRSILFPSEYFPDEGNFVFMCVVLGSLAVLKVWVVVAKKGVTEFAVGLSLAAS